MSKGYRPFVFFGLIVFIYFIGLPIIVTHFYSGIIYDEKTAHIASTIGGIAGPLVALAAIVLTFVAFHTQKKANEAQNPNFNLQQFESTYFNLLTIQKEKVQSISIENGNHEGTEAFKILNIAIREAFKSLIIGNEQLERDGIIDDNTIT